MQTKLYKRDILKTIDSIRSSKVTTTTYDYLLDNSYIASGKPTETMIFLDYNDFSQYIEEFFDALYNDVYTICSSANKEYIINLFKFAPYAMEAEKIKTVKKEIGPEYERLEVLNHSNSYNLVKKINEIKKFYLEKYIFLYDKIRDNFGAKLQQENEIFLCPYCQRNYVNIIQKNSLTIKPDLDHFYPKAKYPFLAATLDNLIPACQVCNSRLKKEIDFYKIKHLHPLTSSEKIFSKLKFLYLGNKNIYIKGKSILSVEEQQYIKTFRIEEIYNTHTEVLDDILEKNKKYNYVKKHHILKTCPSMGMRTIKELVFHEYINIDDKKVPMSSLKKSLFEKIVT